jgi:hypothetical protein
MEEKKIIKVKTFGGRETTYVVDERLNGVAERMKLPKKYQDVNEQLRKIKNFPK